MGCQKCLPFFFFFFPPLWRYFPQNLVQLVKQIWFPTPSQVSTTGIELEGMVLFVYFILLFSNFILEKIDKWIFYIISQKKFIKGKNVPNRKRFLYMYPPMPRTMLSSASNIWKVLIQMKRLKDCYLWNLLVLQSKWKAEMIQVKWTQSC